MATVIMIMDCDSEIVMLIKEGDGGPTSYNLTKFISFGIHTPEVTAASIELLFS